MTSYEYGDGKSSPFSLVLDYFSRAGSSISEFVDQSEGQSSETTRLLDNGTKKRLFGIETERCDEIPSFIQERRKEFHDELQRIDSKTAFGHAIQQAPQYVESLEISFLRAEDWNPRKASIRMLNFFEAKSSLFGLQVLGRRLQIDDLDSDDQICLRSGSFQILPSRDKDSKRVLCFFPKNSADDRTRSLVRLGSIFPPVVRSESKMSQLSFFSSTDESLVVFRHETRGSWK